MIRAGGNVITGIGSFPFTDVDEAIDLIFSTCREIPFWPQLPRRSSVENMFTTFLENVPSVRVDPEKNTFLIDTDSIEGIETFYEDYASDNIDSLKITDAVAPGLYRFLERLKEIEDGIKYIKCQLTGPISMGLGLKDKEGKSILYNSAFYDIIKKALHMKARWMINTIKKIYPGKEVIIFFDEPYMVSFGSAYVSISREEAISILDEVTEGLPARRGVHVCGNTDWSVLFNSTVDIINYDAYGYLDTIFYFKEELARFLARGGWIAPGVVPSTEQIRTATPEEIRKLCLDVRHKLTEVSNKTDGDNLLFTTSCGVGSLTEEEARRAMHLLSELGKQA